MPKMSIERFREIKSRIVEIKDLIDKVDNEEITLSDEEEEKINSEIEQLIDEVHCSDLSDIPFEEYEGFFDIGFDFEGTKANIDFKIIDTSLRYGTVRVKGCNVRNFDFESQSYDDDSFDDAFVMEHQEKFLSRDIPKDVRDKYYRSDLGIGDILRYKLFDAIQSERLSYRAKKFFGKVSPEIVQTVTPTLIEILDEASYSTFVNKLEQYDGMLNEETFKNFIRDELNEVISKTYLSPKIYKKIVDEPSIREYVPDERLIDFKEDDELASKYLDSSLSLSDVYKNREVFQGKEFVDRTALYKYNPGVFEGVTSEKISYLFKEFPDISEGLVEEDLIFLEIAKNIDTEASKEENVKKIQIQVGEILNDIRKTEYMDQNAIKSLERYFSLETVESRLSENEKWMFDKIMQYTTREKIESYGISPRVFEDNSVLTLFYKYGFETVMEFDKANGNIFSKNDFALAKRLGKYYFHYAGNQHNMEKSIFYRSDDPEDVYAPYSMSDFEECVRRMIVEGPTDYNYNDVQPIDFRDFSDQFKNKYPEMFLAEDAPKELQDKFYSRDLKTEDFQKNPSWTEYLNGKNIEIGMKFPNVYVRNEETYDSISLLDLLKKITNSDNTAILNFIVENSITLAVAERLEDGTIDSIYIPNENISIEDFKNILEKTVEDAILCQEVTYGEPQIPPFFREKHPEFVLDDDAPADLKRSFYTFYLEEVSYSDRLVDTARDHKLSIEDIIDDEYRFYLEGKSFELIRGADEIKNLTKVFSLGKIAELYYTDDEALLDVYGQSYENANTLKLVLDTYPRQYAKEELMSGLKLSDEEFENKLLEDDELRSKFEEIEKRYEEDLIKNPGFVLYIQPEKQSREMLKQYKEISSMNMLHGSNRFSRGSYEQILGHMIDFLGYNEAKKLLEIPEIDEETLSRIYEHDEIIKSLYEKKFEIVGNIKVISKLFEGIPGLMPTPEKITSKNTCKVFKSINDKLNAGYNGDITTLLTEAFAENGITANSEEIQILVDRVVEISTLQKLDSVRENNSVVIDTNIQENQKTRNMLKIQYRNALEYSLNKSERIDPNLVREYLDKEFARINENGQPYYSPHVTTHLDELVSFADHLTKNPEWNRKLNHSVVDDLREESRKIGKGWIRKITTNICYKPDKLTYEEAETLDGLIYPEESGLEIDTKASVGIKKLSEEEKNKLYDLLNNDDYRGLFTYGKAENMFSALVPPYSERFKEFFLRYKDEFISNPDLYTKFTAIASRFDNYLDNNIGLNTKFNEKTLIPADILNKMRADVYPDIPIGKGEYELIYQAKNAGLNEEQVKIALELLKDMKKREYQAIPQEQYQTKHYRGRIVRMDDPLHFAIGEITNCCQTIGINEPGESSMIHSATEKNGSLFIVEELDDSGKPIGIVSQSWTWRNGNRVCFDNVEIPSKVEMELKRTGGFDEIMSVYEEAAKRMIETDRLKLDKLLRKGKITEEQYKAMVIKDVAMGVGCDDLLHNLSPEKNDTIKAVTSVPPAEVGKTYNGAGTRVLYYDSRSAVLIAHNDEFASDDHTHFQTDVADYGVKYQKTRDIMIRKGIDIDPDKIESISNMVERSGISSCFHGSNNITEVAQSFGLYDLENDKIDRLGINMSDSGDWYIFSEETDDGIMIHESGFDTSEPKTEHEKNDRKMAISEYTREMYKLMLEASSKGKLVTIDRNSTHKFINLNSLVDDEIISVEDGAITVTDPEKLQEKISQYDKTLEEQRRKRLLEDVENEQR